MTITKLTKKQIDIFWRKIQLCDINDCWPWLASKLGDGYGQVSFNGKVYKAHRIAYMLTKGDIPASMCVCHTCDNPACCNPSHLWLGTKADNNKDKALKGRIITKLTKTDVTKIRQLANKQTQRHIAKQFEVSQAQICHIINNQQWQHVD